MAADESISDHLQVLHQEGQLVSHGSFTLDLERATELFSRGLALNPYLYLLKAVQIFVGGGTQGVKVTLGRFSLSCSGPVEAGFAGLVGEVVATHPTLSRIGRSNHLSWACWGAVAAGASRVRWAFPGGGVVFEREMGLWSSSTGADSESVQATWTVDFPIEWSWATLGHVVRRNWGMHHSLAQRFGRSPVVVEVDGRPVNANKPLQEFIVEGVPGKYLLEYVRLASDAPAFSTCVPATHRPRWFQVYPDSPLLEFSHMPPGGGLFYMLDFGGNVEFTVDQRHSLSPRPSFPQLPRQITALRSDLRLPHGESEIAITPPEDFISIPPQGGSGFHLTQRDFQCATYPQMRARVYLSYLPHLAKAAGKLCVIQDGLLHDPVALATPGLVIYVAASGLPSDLNGLSLVRGAELEALLEELSSILGAWLQACLKHSLWGAEVASQLAALAQSPALKLAH